jgi:hypothetical protein
MIAPQPNSYGTLRTGLRVVPFGYSFPSREQRK